MTGKLTIKYLLCIQIVDLLILILQQQLVLHKVAQQTFSSAPRFPPEEQEQPTHINTLCEIFRDNEIKFILRRYTSCYLLTASPDPVIA